MGGSLRRQPDWTSTTSCTRPRTRLGNEAVPNNAEPFKVQPLQGSELFETVPPNDAPTQAEMNKPSKNKLHKAKMTRLLNHELSKTKVLELLMTKLTILAIKINNLLKLHKAEINEVKNNVPFTYPRTLCPK